jgi:hypothetical protein
MESGWRISFNEILAYVILGIGFEGKTTIDFSKLKEGLEAKR